MTKTRSVIMRFVKVFIMGGLTSVFAIPVFNLTNFDSTKAIFLTLFFAFFSGALAAIEKAYNWVD